MKYNIFDISKFIKGRAIIKGLIIGVPRILVKKACQK